MKNLILLAIVFFSFGIANGQDADELYKKAKAEMSNSNYSDAVKLLTQAIDIKKDASYYFERGTSYYFLKEYDNSGKDFTSAID